MALDKGTFDQIIQLLVPYIGSGSERRALVESAFYGSRVLQQISWEGSAQSFTINLVRTLVTYGQISSDRQAIVALLETLQDQVGTNKRYEIQKIISQIEGTDPQIPKSVTPIQETANANTENRHSDEQVFISYSRLDGKRHAIEVEREISKIPRRVWRDDNDRHLGKYFDTEIEQAIDQSTYVLICLTKDMKNADCFARLEMLYAALSKKNIITLRFEDIAPPLRVLDKDMIDLFGGKWNEGIRRVRELIIGKSTTRSNQSNITAIFSPNQIQYSDYLEAVLLSLVIRIRARILHSEALKLSSVDSPESVHKNDHQMADVVSWLKKQKSFSLLENFENFEAAYKHHKGRVLLLGEPGSGKTTTLLAFARDMVTARQLDNTLPLPIYIQIASWDARQRPPLLDWLKQAEPKLADDLESLLNEGRLLLILDGLDELGDRRVEEERDISTGAIIQINDYDPRERFMQIIPRNNRVVISSRIKDYEDIGTKFSTLEGAARLRPLSDEQLNNYLKKLPALWEMLQADQDLLELARSPLLITIITIAFGERTDQLSSLKNKNSTEVKDAIFGKFVEYRYVFEQEKKGAKILFDYNEYFAILSQIAAADAVSENLEENIIYPHYFENEVTRRSVDKMENLNEQELKKRSEDFIELALRLSMVVRDHDWKGQPIFRFVHLMLRDYFAFALSKENLSSDQVEKREYAARLLGRLKDTRIGGLLTKLLNDKHILVQRAAIESLGEQRVENAVEPLIQFLNDDRVPALEQQEADQFIQLTPLARKELARERMSSIAAVSLRKIGTQRAFQAVQAWETYNLTKVEEPAEQRHESNLAEIGLIPLATSDSLFDSVLLEPEDIIVWGVNNSVMTHIVIWNKDIKPLKNYRLRIKHDQFQEGMIKHEIKSNVRHEPEEPGIDSYLGDILLPSDRLVIYLRIIKLPNGDIPLGVHRFICTLYAENLTLPISVTLRVEIKSPL